MFLKRYVCLKQNIPTLLMKNENLGFYQKRQNTNKIFFFDKWGQTINYCQTFDQMGKLFLPNLEIYHNLAKYVLVCKKHSEFFPKLFYLQTFLLLSNSWAEKKFEFLRMKMYLKLFSNRRKFFITFNARMIQKRKSFKEINLSVLLLATSISSSSQVIEECFLAEIVEEEEEETTKWRKRNPVMALILILARKKCFWVFWLNLKLHLISWKSSFNLNKVEEKNLLS